MASREWKWTKRRAEAAALLAEDELSDERIAVKVGVSRHTIAMWKLNPTFAKRVANLVAEWERKVMNAGIANKARRVRALNYLYDLHMQIVNERAENFELGAKGETGNTALPGGSTGLMVAERKILGYDDGKPVIEQTVTFDSSLSREIRATLHQAADEMGHSIEKHEIFGKDGDSIQVSISILDTIAERVRLAKAHARVE